MPPVNCSSAFTCAMPARFPAGLQAQKGFRRKGFRVSLLRGFLLRGSLPGASALQQRVHLSNAVSVSGGVSGAGFQAPGRDSPHEMGNSPGPIGTASAWASGVSGAGRGDCHRRRAARACLVMVAFRRSVVASCTKRRSLGTCRTTRRTTKSARHEISAPRHQSATNPARHESALRRCVRAACVRTGASKNAESSSYYARIPGNGPITTF